MLGTKDVARMYAVLTEHASEILPTGSTTTFPRGSLQIVDFLSGYCNHRYEIEKCNFYDDTGMRSAIAQLKPVERDLYSICVVYERPNNQESISQKRRRIQIFINTGALDDGESDSILNYCWTRFCLVKEACQAIFFEDHVERQIPYPTTILFDEVGTLMSRINNEPFSLWDFEDEDYGSELAVENAAELLATGLLAPFEDLLEIQSNILEKRGQVGLRVHNYLAIADYYKVPRRYVEVLITWKGLQPLVSDIERARRGEL